VTVKPSTAYNRLNKLLWLGRLPAATIKFLDNETIPRCYGLTLFDQDFARPVIFLNADEKKWGRTLLHECLHVAEPQLPHGIVFEKLVNSYWRYARKHIKQLRGL
jgi:hypothetical protein